MAIPTVRSIAKLPTHFHNMKKLEKGLLILTGIAIAAMIIIIEWMV